MAVEAIQPQQTNLLTYLRTWNRRLRQTQTLAWLARALMPGLMLGITVALISRFRPWLTVEEVLLVTLAGVAAGLVVLIGAVWLWPRSTLQIARRFDVDFGLKERVSTALEVAEGRIRAHELLREPQAYDAVFHAGQINAGQRLPFTVNWREWAVVLSLALILAILLVLPNPQADALGEDAARQAAIQAAEEDIREAISDVAADTSLDEETRESLLESLERNLETLQDDDISEEEAIATVSEARDLLNEEATGLQEQSNEQQAALDAAAQGLSEMQDDAQNEAAGSEGEETGTGETAAEALESAANGLENMSQEQMNALAEQLENAANALEQTAPEAAEALREAAEALREGDTEAAQQAMQEAADALRDAQQQQQQTQESAQNLEQSAQQLQATQNNLQQQSQQQQQQGQQSQQQAQQQTGQQQQGQQQQGQQGQEGQTGQQQQGQTDNQPGQQQSSQDGQPGQAGNQGAEGDQAQEGGGAPQQSGQPGEADQGQAAGASSDRGSQEAGTAPGDLSADTSGAEQNESEVQGGGPPPGGERQFEEVFDPRRIDQSANTDSNVQLEADQSDIIRDEGEFSENQAGQVTVPYNQVFNDYANTATEAINQSYIPLALRDVIRDYFLRLDPSGPDGN